MISFIITGLLLVLSVYIFKKLNIYHVINELKTSKSNKVQPCVKTEESIEFTQVLNTELLDNLETQPLSVNLVKNIIVTHEKEEKVSFE